jgi:hypothetical protein
MLSPAMLFFLGLVVLIFCLTVWSVRVAGLRWGWGGDKSAIVTTAAFLLICVAVLLLSGQDKATNAGIQSRIQDIAARSTDLAKRAEALRINIPENAALILDATQKQDTAQLKLHRERLAQINKEQGLVSEQATVINNELATIQSALSDFKAAKERREFWLAIAMLICSIPTLLGAYYYYSARNARLDPRAKLAPAKEPVDPTLSTQVIELIRNGKKIEAIASYRNENTVDLPTAKLAVENYMNQK